MSGVLWSISFSHPWTFEMYIFRSKNTRDNRFPDKQHIFSTAPPSESFDVTGDEQLRCDEEKDHIGFYHDNLRLVLSEYLTTNNGKHEINILRKELGTARLLLLSSEDQKEKRPLSLTSLFTKAKRLDPRSLVDHNEACRLILEAGTHKVRDWQTVL